MNQAVVGAVALAGLVAVSYQQSPAPRVERGANMFLRWLIRCSRKDQWLVLKYGLAFSTLEWRAVIPQNRRRNCVLTGGRWRKAEAVRLRAFGASASLLRT